MDQAELARSRRNSGSGQGLRFGSEAPETDPWATEARLVAQLGRLATAQVRPRLGVPSQLEHATIPCRHARPVAVH